MNSSTHNKCLQKKSRSGGGEASSGSLLSCRAGHGTRALKVQPDCPEVMIISHSSRGQQQPGHGDRSQKQTSQTEIDATRGAERISHLCGASVQTLCQKFSSSTAVSRPSMVQAERKRHWRGLRLYDGRGNRRLSHWAPSLPVSVMSPMVEPVGEEQKFSAGALVLHVEGPGVSPQHL